MIGVAAFQPFRKPSSLCQNDFHPPSHKMPIDTAPNGFHIPLPYSTLSECPPQSYLPMASPVVSHPL